MNTAIEGTDLPSPPLWGRDGEGGPNQARAAAVESDLREAPPSLTLPHEGGGDQAHANRTFARAHVDARQRSRAKRLRRELTPAERKLWHALKAHRFQALHMRRQVPMGPYIADFVCHRTRLVIELDGEQHGYARNAAADERRDAWLAEQGYRVLRFWNVQIFKEFESVLDTIFAAVQDQSRGAHL